MSDRRKAPARADAGAVRPVLRGAAGSARPTEVLFLEPLRPLAGEAPEAFADRGLRALKRGLARRVLMPETGDGARVREERLRRGTP